MLRHLPFFEVLGDTEEGSADWRAISAGLLVVRLFDSWIEYGHEIVTTDMTGLRAIREAIAAIDAIDPSRELLFGIVDAMYQAEMVDVRPVAPKMIAYASSLDLAGKPQLALDVLQNLLGVLDPFEDPELAISANMRLGAVCRVQGEFEEAEKAYTVAGEIADRIGDTAKKLLSQVGFANLTRNRGNLPRAAEILDSVILQADVGGYHDVQATAQQDRGVVAFHMGDYETAIRYAFIALGEMENPRSRDRVLLDIAGYFQSLGSWSSARDAFLILSCTAEEQYTKWIATINLMEIASLDGVEVPFQKYRSQLESISLPPYLNASYHLVLGQGYHRFGKLAEARASLEEASELATKYRLNQLIFQAERSLAEVSVGAEAEKQLEAAPPQEIDFVAVALREMREEVAV